MAHLASVGPGGRPHIVPLVFALLEETIYSVVDQKPKRGPNLRRLANVRADPRVALMVDHYSEDWQALWWVRADGTGRILAPEGSESARALSALAGRYPQQRPMGEILAVDVERWTGWSARK